MTRDNRLGVLLISTTAPERLAAMATLGRDAGVRRGMDRRRLLLLRWFHRGGAGPRRHQPDPGRPRRGVLHGPSPGRHRDGDRHPGPGVSGPVPTRHRSRGTRLGQADGALPAIADARPARSDHRDARAARPRRALLRRGRVLHLPRRKPDSPSGRLPLASTWALSGRKGASWPAGSRTATCFRCWPRPRTCRGPGSRPSGACAPQAAAGPSGCPPMCCRPSVPTAAVPAKRSGRRWRSTSPRLAPRR